MSQSLQAFEEMKQVEAALHETSDVQDDLCLDESSAAANGDAGNFNAAEEEVVPDIDLTAGVGRIAQCCSKCFLL